MNKYYIITLITILTFVSCGKSKEQLELEKAKQELKEIKLELVEKQKVEDLQRKIQAKKNEELKIYQQKLNVGKKKKQIWLNELLSQANSALSKAKHNYKKVNEFQFGRTLTTKNKQLKEAQNKINVIKDYIKNIKTEIAESEMTKIFNFQNQPETVVEYLFIAAKNRDFSKLRYLSDPFSENDADTRGLCYVGMLPYSEQNKFIENFKNGRIIGKPIINGDKAEVEFAFGQGSNRLEKMSLVKRMGKWYLESF